MHLTSVADLSDGEVEAILATAKTMQQGSTDALAGRIVCSAFFEPSTRTRLSFEAATHRLGADVIGFADGACTSTVKGESLEDSIRTLAGYSDAIVLRHPEEGAAARAASVSPVPVVNAGDGSGEHPTQALLDLFTIRENVDALEGVRVAVMGDLRYGRTVHSLVPLLRRFGIEVVQVPAGELGLPGALGSGVEVVTLQDAVKGCDVLYMTRVQQERFPTAKEYADAAGGLRLEAKSLLGSSAIVMHPFPRVDELDASLDGLPAAKYFEQLQNGVPVRMAVLLHVLEREA